MESGFDCAKPDIIVMKAAVDLGIVAEPERQRKNPEKRRTSRHYARSVRSQGSRSETRPTLIALGQRHFNVLSVGLKVGLTFTGKTE